MKRGTIGGDKRGLASAAVFGVLEVDKRSHEGCYCPTTVSVRPGQSNEKIYVLRVIEFTGVNCGVE